MIALDEAGQRLALAAGMPGDDAVFDLQGPADAATFVERAAGGKVFEREGAPGTDQ